MIGQIAVRVTADRANFPLGTLFVRRGSAANVALVGVPVRAGVDVESVTVRIENADGETADFAARQFGGVWVVDIPAAHFATVGSVTGGVAVFATGTGADDETERTWNIGVGDLEVLSADADAPAPTPGQTFWPLRMFDAAPTSLTKYSAYLNGGKLMVYNGEAWVEISGGSIDVDDAVTRTGANPVKSSGIWGAIWGALTALPTGFASLYDWVVAQLEGKLSTSGGTMTGRIYALLATLKWGTDPDFARFTIPGATNEHYMCFGYKDSNFGLFVKNGSDSAERFYALPSSGGDIAMIQDLAGKASAADLRYRIAEAAVRKTLPADCFPVTLTYEGVSYSIDALVEESEASAAGDMFLSAFGNTYSLGMVVSPAGSEGELMDVIKVATFDGNGVYESGHDSLWFGGVSPVADTSPTLADVQILADRAVNLITATDETSIDIELPAAVTVDGVRRARDFILDVDNSAGASDIGLELASDATAYLDAGGAHCLIAVVDGDDLADLLTVAAGKRARLYFTETAQTATPTGGTSAVPVISLQRLTVVVGGAA